MQPKLFYSQRNGSSLLCEALKSTGVVGTPGELFHKPPEVSRMKLYEANDYQDLKQKIWKEGSPNSDSWHKSKCSKIERRSHYRGTTYTIGT